MNSFVSVMNSLMPSSYVLRARKVNLPHLGPRVGTRRGLGGRPPGAAGWVDARTPRPMGGVFSVLMVWFNHADACSVPMAPHSGDEGTRRCGQPAHGTSSCQRSGFPYGCGR